MRGVAVTLIVLVCLPVLIFNGITPALAGTIQYDGPIGTNSGSACGTSAVKVNPVEDTHVEAASPTTNFGSATGMWVRSASNSAGLARSLLRFNLPSIPVGCTLASAQLRVNLTTSNGGTAHSIYRANSAWSEGTTTWNTQPGVVGSSTTGNPTSSTGWHEFQVTPLVDTMYQTTNNGFVIRNEQPQDRSHQLASRESATPPELELTWGTAKSTTTTIAVPAGGVPAGNSVIVTFVIDPWSVGPVSASDSKGNSYSLDATGTQPSAGRNFILSAHNVNQLVPGDTITITHPQTVLRAGTANQYSGLAPTNTRDGTSASSGFDASPTAGSVSTTAPDELIVGSFVTDGWAATFTPGAGYTALPPESIFGYWKLSTEHRIVSTTGTYSATGTLEAAHNWAAAMATYKMDTDAPVVAITAPSDGTSTNDQTPDLAGTAGSLNSDSTTITVKIYAGASATGSPVQTLTTTRDGAGAWSTTASNLNEGTYTAVAEQEDGATNTGTSPPVTFSIESTDPAAPSITGPTPNPGNTAAVEWSFTGEPGATFECRLMYGTTEIQAWTSCSGPQLHTLANGDGPYTFSVRQTDLAGNTSPVASDTYDLDTDPPEAPVITGPVTPGNDADVSWDFTSEGTATPECKLAKGSTVIEDFTTCSSPKNYTLTNGDGTYTFTVRQVDPAGNVSPESSDDYELDSSVPDTSIDTGPSGPTNDPDAEFEFSSNESGAVFECELDGSGFSTCSSPASFTSLAEGPHTLRVRALDSAGNVDATPAERTFNVDTLAPDLPTLVGPPSPSSNATPEWSFGGEPGASFECRVEKGGSIVSPLASCASPNTFTLSDGDGTYTFFVRQLDAAGNASGFTSADWDLDTSLPDTQIDSGPSGPTPNVDVSFTFSSSESGSTFECDLDGGGFNSCTSPKDYTSLADGPHTFRVRATDAAGNTDDTPAERTFTIDTGVPDVPALAGPPSPGNDTSPEWSFTGEAGAGFECRLEKGGAIVSPLASCTNPHEYTLSDGDGTYTFSVRQVDAAGNASGFATHDYNLDADVPNAPQITGPPGNGSSPDVALTFNAEPGNQAECKLVKGWQLIEDWKACSAPETYTLVDGDGTYTFSVRQTDDAGNTSPEATQNYDLDTRVPDTQVDSGPSGLTNNANPSFGFSSDESGVNFECEMDGSGFTPCNTPKDYSSVADGDHLFRVRAIDAANNVDLTPAVRSFTVDTGAPPVSIDSGPPDISNDRTPQWDFSTDPGAELQCELSTGGVPVSPFAPCNSGSASYDLAGESDGTYVFRVAALDGAGNSSEAWDAYVLDTGKPDSVAWSTSTTGTPNITVTYTYADGLSQVTEVELWAKGPSDGSFAPVATDTSPASASFNYTASQGDGRYDFFTRALDEAGNQEDASSADSSTVLDTAGPTTSIDSSPPGQTSTAPFDFTFSASDPSASFECSLTMDGSDAYMPCGTPISYPDSGQGVYTFKVRATDTAGNTGDPATYTFAYATSEPTEIPTDQPTDPPTDFPTEQPTERPTELPTIQPTEHPTEMPTDEPTLRTGDVPALQPIENPVAPTNLGGGSPNDPTEGPRQPRKNEDAPNEWREPASAPKDDPPKPEGDGKNPEEDLATLAKVAVEAFAFPLLLAVLVVFYLLVQYWLDRKDPKLAMAPVHSKHDLARFS